MAVFSYKLFNQCHTYTPASFTAVRHRRRKHTVSHAGEVSNRGIELAVNGTPSFNSSVPRSWTKGRTCAGEADRVRP